MEDLNSPSSAKEAADREAARESIFLSAEVKFSSTNQPVPVRVRNISAGGMMIDCAAAAVIGEPVSVDIKNMGCVTGRVAWSVGPRMGIAFDTEINPSAARIRAKAPHDVDEAYRGPSSYRRPGLVVR